MRASSALRMLSLRPPEALCLLDFLLVFVAIFTLSADDFMADQRGKARSPTSAGSRYISPPCRSPSASSALQRSARLLSATSRPSRSEEHTSELQSRFDLVCRLLLEKKKYLRV